MAKPLIHAMSSARKFGGTPDDYLPIHELLDSSKEAFPDNRHRALTHHSWFVKKILPRIFGVTITVTLEDGRERQVSVEEIGEQHVLEDFGTFIPAAADFLGETEMKAWMDNGRGEFPPSHAKIAAKRRVIRVTYRD